MPILPPAHPLEGGLICVRYIELKTMDRVYTIPDAGHPPEIILT